MTNYAQIIFHQHELPLGRYYFTYEWEGKLTDPVYISLNYEDHIKSFPWPLWMIDAEPWIDRALYVRKDSNFWWLTSARYALRRFIEPIYYRLIITLMVWGLAYTPQGVVPSWRDIGKKRP